MGGTGLEAACKSVSSTGEDHVAPRVTIVTREVRHVGFHHWQSVRADDGGFYRKCPELWKGKVPAGCPDPMDWPLLAAIPARPRPSVRKRSCAAGLRQRPAGTFSSPLGPRWDSSHVP